MTIDEARDIIQARAEWLRAFQFYCDSDEIREESEINGINACGYGIQCDECLGSDAEESQCARAMERFMKNRRIAIDYRNMSKEYFRKLLMGEKNGFGKRCP